MWMAELQPNSARLDSGFNRDYYKACEELDKPDLLSACYPARKQSIDKSPTDENNYCDHFTLLQATNYPSTYLHCKGKWVKCSCQLTVSFCSLAPRSNEIKR
jgi:hypothetical protein